jgi:hypothetical protein
VFLFNIGGYYIVFFGLRFHSDIQIQQRLESNQLSSEETLLLKIPMPLPYSTGEKDFEYIKGNFEHKGEFYKLLKQKHENDTLYIVCLKDHKEKSLVRKMIDYGNLSNDLATHSKKTQNILSKLLKEYEPLHEQSMTHNTGWTMRLTYAHLISVLTPFERSVQSPPPRQLS